MTTIAGHLSVEALRDRYVSSADVCEARHFQTIWLLAKGHSVGEVAEMTSFGYRWIEQLVVRYNAEGPESLGDLRRRNGATASVLKPEVLDKLRVRLKEPPDDGGLWTSAKVAAFIARELGLERVAVQRGWEALKACGMSIQTPRPKNPKSASPEEAAAFKKSCRTPSPKKPRNIPNGRSRSSRATSIGSA
jgi:transposase